MIDGKLKDIVSSVDTLPSLPSLYSKLQEKISAPETSLDDIGNIISQDIAMTAKILQLVNSAFLGLYQNVERFKKDIINNSLLAGILHDIGKLVLLSKLESEYADAVALARQERITLNQAEKKIFKASHCDMGAYLTGLWGFNSDIVEAIGFHHRLGEYPVDTFSPALAVHIANILYYRYHSDEAVGSLPEFNEEYLHKINLGEKLLKWQDLCSECMGGLTAT